ncbi:MAG TPA: hypothetical protein VNK95_08935 [Caldilineaceae bacterium]|nr:hypothetical protein [Caldilineaceae bacterium]
MRITKLETLIVKPRWVILKIHKLLGGPLRDRIKVYAHCRGETPDALAEHGWPLVAQGFLALKTHAF